MRRMFGCRVFARDGWMGLAASRGLQRFQYLLPIKRPKYTFVQRQITDRWKPRCHERLKETGRRCPEDGRMEWWRTRRRRKIAGNKGASAEGLCSLDQTILCNEVSVFIKQYHQFNKFIRMSLTFCKLYCYYVVWNVLFVK
ncbi:uncharacterized protein LOC144768272 [Lissotriton helveticus]